MTPIITEQDEDGEWVVAPVESDDELMDRLIQSIDDTSDPSALHESEEYDSAPADVLAALVDIMIDVGADSEPGENGGLSDETKANIEEIADAANDVADGDDDETGLKEHASSPPFPGGVWDDLSKHWVKGAEDVAGEEKQSKAEISTEPKRRRLYSPDSIPNANKNLPDEARPELDASEQKAAKAYAAESYEDINKRLRMGKDVFPQHSETHKALQAIFDATPPLPKPVIVGRQIGKMPKEKLAEFIGHLYDAKENGAVVTMPGYTSTSTETGLVFEQEPAVEMLIKAHHGVCLRPYSQYPDEDELLLNHNSRFHVTKVSPPAQPGGAWQVEMEQIYP